jgi:hypothetical protein
MTEKKTEKECPECCGKKIIPGECICNSEWRGTQVGDDWNECQCSPDVPCPNCNGTGVVEE